jgi:deoxyribodipyrimidine photo-lyase
MDRVPDVRIRTVNDRPVHAGRGPVLYWMTTCRRSTSNFSLMRACEHAASLDVPLVVYEPLPLDAPHACKRLHQFIAQGMRDNQRAFADTPVAYLPFVERAPGESDALLQALVEHASVVVTDDFPSSFVRRVIARVAGRASARVEAVDANGIIPMRSAGRTFATAHSFRRFVQRTFREHIAARPVAAAFSTLRRARLPVEISRRWQAASARGLASPERLIGGLAIDGVVDVVDTTGGMQAGRTRLHAFVRESLLRYAKDARHPDLEASSRLSPYLHFGHVGVHEIFDAVMTAERWTTRKLGGQAGGAREGWWGVSTGAEAFLDQVIVWRELGFNLCETRPDDYDAFSALPDWARATLKRHARDRRPWLYSRAEFEAAATHDAIWNAAQRQLVRDGWMHNYLRMLWGKKILEWSRTPEEALETMASLMNTYALDGRDPNSYSGYCWTLGRYDRPWAPERPIYGTVRYMSSDNTRRKLKMKGFLERYGA